MASEGVRHRTEGDAAVPRRPPATQLVLAAINLTVPGLVLGWAWANGHREFFEWQTVAAMGVLFVLGIDTLYQWWLADSWAGVETGGSRGNAP